MNLLRFFVSEKWETVWTKKCLITTPESPTHPRRYDVPGVLVLQRNNFGDLRFLTTNGLSECVQDTNWVIGNDKDAERNFNMFSKQNYE